MSETQQKFEDVKAALKERDRIIHDIQTACAAEGIHLSTGAIHGVLWSIRRNQRALDFLARH